MGPGHRFVRGKFRDLLDRDTEARQLEIENR